MKAISNLSDYYDLSVSQFADTLLSCPLCHREHRIPIKMVQAGTKLISHLPVIMSFVNHGELSRFGVVYDRHIEKKINTLFFDEFNQLDYSYVRIPLGDRGLLLEASTEVGDQAAEVLPEDIDFIIGVGSGVICDLTKWIATKSKRPFIIFGTAASMNAYTSITGTMTENNVKSTRWLDPPKAVLMDSALIASAPHNMTCAGVGDLLARQVANADWMLSHRIRETYFCPVPFQMMASFQDALIPVVHKLSNGDFSAMKKLSDAILASGYSMTVLDGETSPSSGSEHVISHFFDFQHELFSRPKNLHGEQVGIGTIIMAMAFEILKEIKPNQLDIDRILNLRPTINDIHQDNIRTFGEYHQVFDQVVASKRIPDNHFPAYLQKIIQNWDQLWQDLHPYTMPAKRIRQIMKDIGGCTALTGIQRTQEDALQALLYGAKYRSRFTILDLYWELGLFPEYAQVILEESGVLENV